MRRLGLCAAFLTGVVAVLAAAGCGGETPSASHTTPNTKQMEKEGGRVGGPKMK
ncbi:MAG: hypothetical protein ABGY75_07210 [Gemmataceae bacterium]